MLNSHFVSILRNTPRVLIIPVKKIISNKPFIIVPLTLSSAAKIIATL